MNENIKWSQNERNENIKIQPLIQTGGAAILCKILIDD